MSTIQEKYNNNNNEFNNIKKNNIRNKRTENYQHPLLPFNPGTPFAIVPVQLETSTYNTLKQQGAEATKYQARTLPNTLPPIPSPSFADFSSPPSPASFLLCTFISVTRRSDLLHLP